MGTFYPLEVSLRKIEPDSHSALVAAFRSHAFATVPCLLEPHVIPEAVERFFAFLNLPQNIKEPLAYKHRTDRRGGRAGYKNSDPEPPHDPDGKEIFQFHPSMRLRFAAERKRIPELDQLMESAERIYAAGNAIVRSVLNGFEPIVSGITEEFFPQDSHPFFHLRFLRYKRTLQRNGAFTAVGHYDIGSLTVAFAESAPGLRIGGDAPAPLTEVIYREGSVLIMPSWNFPNEVPGQGFVPAWHDVIQRPERAYNDDTARWAIVLFADGRHAVSPSWEETHTRRGTVSSPQQLRFA